MAAKKPTYWTALNIEQGASKQKIVAAYRKAATEMHPDKAPERAAEFALVTAAYNVLKANPLHVFGGKSDLAWQRDFIAATVKPTAEGDKYVFVKKDGEDKAAARRRYARESQAFRYAKDPEFAAARRAASKKCNDKKAAAKAAAKAEQDAKDAAASASPAAA